MECDVARVENFEIHQINFESKPQESKAVSILASGHQMALISDIFYVLLRCYNPLHTTSDYLVTAKLDSTSTKVPWQ